MGFIELKEEHIKGQPYRIRSNLRIAVSSQLAVSLKMTKVKPIILMNHITTLTTDSGYGRSTLHSSSFLKSCFFCNKTLRLDKEVYMYRGELGFCSVDCRNRQIYLDEMTKIETYTKKMLASFRQRREGSQCSKSTVLSNDYRQRGNSLSRSETQVTFTFT